MKTFLSPDEVNFLYRVCGEAWKEKVVRLSRRNELTAIEWERICRWCELRKEEIANAPTVHSLAYLAALDDVKPVNVSILEGCSFFNKYRGVGVSK